jgi:dihydropyrimidinase
VDLVVAGGTVVTAADTFVADVGIADGRIVQVGGEMPETARRLDARGKLVLPGGVDPHTHLDSPSQGTVTADDFATGGTAALCGGTTTVVDFCFPPRGGTLAEGVADWHRRADGRSPVDYAFHVAITEERDALVDEIPRLADLGVRTLKLFMAYRSSVMVGDRTIYRVLRAAARHGMLVLVHCENGDAVAEREAALVAAGKLAPRYHAEARPPRVEAEATARAVALAELAEAPLYVVHVSCPEALEEIERGRARGVEVFAETCPQYLYCTAEDLGRPDFEGAKYVCSPAPRDRASQAALWRALGRGAIQTVGSDHSAFSTAQKARGRHDFTKIPNGVPGIEERLTLLYQGVVEGKLTLERFVDAVSTAPARLMGLYPRKGTIAPGADADLVLWDPDADWTIAQAALHHCVDYTPYEGLTVRGRAETVFRRGEVVVENGQPVGAVGGGLYLAR